MKISGFTIIRNGVKFDYPFIESILSILPVCDEFIAVVGDSDDGTREKIESLRSPKIKIIDTVWDETLRTGGRILSQQTNIALDHITGDWGFYLQGDEVVHENDLDIIAKEMHNHLHDQNIDGLLFSYYHFWGYHHVCVTRRTYRREIRVVRNTPLIRSFRDAQSFRKYPSVEAFSGNHPGIKLNVRLINARIFAYSRVREPQKELEKVIAFERWWHPDDHISKKYSGKSAFDYEQVDMVAPFDANAHPRVMNERVKKSTWKFHFTKPRFSLKNRLLYSFEKLTGWRIGERRNYKIVSRHTE
ncbi:MAG TPA: glycosyltransferase [Chitinophagales bacterium]|nr:glycosyltransferase [Chitinophagales bacterium]